MIRKHTRPMRASMRYLIEHGEYPEYKPDIAALQEALGTYIMVRALCEQYIAEIRKTLDALDGTSGSPAPSQQQKPMEEPYEQK